jgi:hypothetical protein
LFLVLIIFLVNMDVSVIRSIKHGDYVLISGFIISIIPFILLAKRKPTKHFTGRGKALRP